MPPRACDVVFAHARAQQEAVPCKARHETRPRPPAHAMPAAQRLATGRATLRRVLEHSNRLALRRRGGQLPPLRRRQGARDGRSRGRRAAALPEALGPEAVKSTFTLFNSLLLVRPLARVVVHSGWRLSSRAHHASRPRPCVPALSLGRLLVHAADRPATMAQQQACRAAAAFPAARHERKQLATVLCKPVKLHVPSLE